MSWRQVRGHEKLARFFAQAVERGRLAHAYFFCGPPGVGKRLFARELAKALLCEGPKSAGMLEACDHCPACLLVDAGTHPDFFSVGRPEERNEVPIEAMLDLCRDFSLTPARGKGKVAILDDADYLNAESANCFLKTLEEPPPRSVFILIGTTSEMQLPTVVSRCQMVRFAPLPEATVIDLLKEHGLADAAQNARLARLADGSPGQALALADPDLWRFRGILLEGLARPQPDTVGLARAWKEFMEEAGKETAPQRRRSLLVLRLLIEFLDDALALALGKSPKLTDDLPLLQNFIKKVDADGLVALLDRCLEAEFHFDRYVQLVLVLEGLLDAVGQGLTAERT